MQRTLKWKNSSSFHYIIILLFWKTKRYIFLQKTCVKKFLFMYFCIYIVKEIRVTKFMTPRLSYGPLEINAKLLIITRKRRIWVCYVKINISLRRFMFLNVKSFVCLFLNTCVWARIAWIGNTQKKKCVQLITRISRELQKKKACVTKIDDIPLVLIISDCMLCLILFLFLLKEFLKIYGSYNFHELRCTAATPARQLFVSTVIYFVCIINEHSFGYLLVYTHL